MKAEILIGSPRKNGNTATMAKELANELLSRSVDVNIPFLYDYEIKPCTDCRGCKKGDLTCVLKDDYSLLCQRMEGADIIVFGTPIYWYGPTAKTKLLIDRFRPYFSSKKLHGKKAALLLPAGDGASDCDLTIEMFRRVFETLGIDYLGAVTSKSYNIGDAEKDPDLHNNIGKLIQRIE
jgi:multimeric flavodoxin WrbA